ncbi:MAG: hypothetical protein WCO06_05500 [Candidatus Roizmanbacteria bacterium]
MKDKSIFGADEVIKFFEENTGVTFVDTDSKEPILEQLSKKKIKPVGTDDYDKWLAEQDEDTKLAHKMGAI